VFFGGFCLLEKVEEARDIYLGFCLSVCLFVVAISEKPICLIHNFRKQRLLVFPVLFFFYYYFFFFFFCEREEKDLQQQQKIVGFVVFWRKFVLLSISGTNRF
jgi:hypothetical protein